MDVAAIMNSSGMWIASSFMIIVTLVQAALFFRAGRKEANALGIPLKTQNQSIRSAMITATGPAFAAVIVLISMITVVGAPTTWMRLNVIGAARTELAMTNIACNFLGVPSGGEGFTTEAFTLALWGMALNDLGWLVCTMIFTPNMGKALNYMGTHFDSKWVKMLMSGTVFGCFGYLLLNTCWSKGSETSYCVTAAVVSAVAILLINKLFPKNQRLQEQGLGISMLIGMFAAAALKYLNV